MNFGLDRYRTLTVLAAFALAAVLGGCSHSVSVQDAEELSAPLMERAMAHEDAGENEAAVQIYRKCLDVHPQMARAHLHLGFLLEQDFEDYPIAIYHYRRYLELRPEAEKRELIEARIQAAESALVARVTGATTNALREAVALRNENQELRRRIRALESEIAKFQTRTHVQPRGISGTTTTTLQPPPLPADRKYTVQPGDNLSLIAERFYGDREKFRIIARANKKLLRNSDKIQPGQVLTIPEL